MSRRAVAVLVSSIAFGLGMWNTAEARHVDHSNLGSEPVSIVARPGILGRGDKLTLLGSVDSEKAEEVVTIESKDCGQTSFREVAVARTREGGGWSTELSPGITTTLRAVWKGSASAPVTVRQRAHVSLGKERPGFEVWVLGKQQLWHRRALFQRLDRRLGKWSTLRSVALTETGADDPTGRAGTVWSRATFRASVPKGGLVRAVFPLAQARPCYLAGYSQLLRT